MKNTGWRIQRDGRLAESFRIFAPSAERSYNPILGARNRLVSADRSADGRVLTLTWAQLQTEYSGVLDITLTGIVTLDEDVASFNMTVKNSSALPVASVEWPILGALGRPQGSSTLRRMVYTGGPEAHQASVYPKFQNEFGFCSTNCPGQLCAGRYKMLVSEHEGLYIGNHSPDGDHVLKYALELRPGYAEARWMTVPQVEELDGHAVRIVSSVQHFPFTASGQTNTLATVVMHPFAGDWHKGADFYRRWHASWYKRPANPGWLDAPHAWQQIQINSSENDLRTAYKDFPRRALEAAKAGITVIQLTGWNRGGQDRDNPTQDTEPLLGTHEDLKRAIARVENMGVRVILFNKFNYADTSSEWYRSALHKLMAMDPNDVTYVSHGYKYQTPEQLADMNTRRFAVACMNDDEWLKICAQEFQKSLELGCSGILADEVSGHSGWDFCFSKEHGHRAPQPLWAGDLRLGKLLREKVRQARGEENFLLSGESLWDLLTGYYSLSYVRLIGEHTPISRYSNPSAQIMIAVTGFEDRDMINCALRYRYVMSYEPYNFKGNVNDFPTTMTYGEKMDVFRKRYRSYVWDGEFRDNQDAEISVDGKTYEEFSVFARPDGKRGAVIMNGGSASTHASIQFEGGSRSALAWASPDDPEQHPTEGQVQVPAKSAVLVMEI
ncbi:MAG TPA: DUF6259 domain-containing protein [Bryocella sp.]|nr:DUF6259 domain-containing protein [Bryocella sp.]